MKLSKKIILVGETHGTQGNLTALSYLISNIPNAVVALELPMEWQPSLESLSNGFGDSLKEVSQDSDVVTSGRLSEYHISKYLEMVSTYQTKFLPLRKESDDWNAIDNHIAKELLRLSDTTDQVIIACLGNLHVRKRSFDHPAIPEYVCHPVGELLKDKSTSILIRYGTGGYTNFEQTGSFNNPEVMSVLGEEELVLKESSSTDFDVELYIKDSLSI